MLTSLASATRAKDREDRFVRAIDELKSRSQEPKLASFNLRDRRSGWSSVFGTANAAQQQLEQKRKGFRGIFHRTGKAIGEASPSIEPFLDLLPCGDYSSLVTGSVKLIFAAFERKAETEQMVKDTLKDAPTYLEQAETFLALYSPDAELAKLVDELYVALLEAIEAIIAYLTRSSVRLRGIFKESNVTSKKDELEVAKMKLQGRASDCDKAVTVQTQQFTQEILMRVIYLVNQNEDSKTKLSQLLDGNHEMRDFLITTEQNRKSEHHEVISRFTSHDNDLSELRQDIRDLKEDMKINLGNALAAQQQRTELKMTSLEVERDRSNQERAKAEARAQAAEAQAARMAQALQQPPIIVSMHSPQSEILQPEILVHWLRNAGWGSELEAAHYRQDVRTFNTSRLLATAVTADEKFLDWIASDESRMLFVDLVNVRTKVSPGSFVTATLADLVREQDFAVVLTYFCAQHLEETGDDRVSDTFASLVCQLLAAVSVDLTSWTYNDELGYTLLSHQQLATERGLDYLLELFLFLVKAMQPRPVFVFIDDFYILERNADDDSLDKMADALRRASKETSNLKLLFMTPESRQQRGRISGYAHAEETLRYSMQDLERIESSRGHGSKRRDMGWAPLSAFVSD